MNTSNLLVITLLLMTFLIEVLPSNPDSEVVQDSSYYDDPNRGKPAPMRHSNNQARSAPVSPIRYEGRPPDTNAPAGGTPIHYVKSPTPNNPNGYDIIAQTAYNDGTNSDDNIYNPVNNLRHEIKNAEEYGRRIRSESLPSGISHELSQSHVPFFEEKPRHRTDVDRVNDGRIPPASESGNSGHYFPDKTNGPYNPDSTDGSYNPDNTDGSYNPDSRSRSSSPESMKGPPNAENRNSLSNPDGMNRHYNPDSMYGQHNPGNINLSNKAPLSAKQSYRLASGSRNEENRSLLSRSRGNGGSRGYYSQPSYTNHSEPLNSGSGNNFGAGHGNRPAFSRLPQNPCKGSFCNADEPRGVTKAPVAERMTQPVPTKPVTKPIRNLPPDSYLFADMINEFAFKLIETMQPKGNFIISPLSIYTALSMCYLGSEGFTKSELEIALSMNANAVSGEKLHQGLKDLASLIFSGSTARQLFQANGLFLGSDYPVDREFNKDIRDYYSAELKYLNFRDAGSSIPVINEWVSRNTGNMITSMTDIPPDPSTRLLLLIAMYFKGNWKTQFSKSLTFTGRFFNREGIERTVPTMVLYNETFPLYRNKELKHNFLKLPYQGDEISMILALPHSFEDIPMTDMTNDILCQIRDSMVDTRMDTVSLPRFHQKYFRSLERPLRQIGIRNLFDPKAVNLRKMRKENDLVVSAIMHKAAIEVNEEGTTAAAVTGVRLVPLTFRNTTDFIVNHPFAFYIVHESTGLVLFYGKILDTGAPSGSPNRRQG